MKEKEKTKKRKEKILARDKITLKQKLNFAK
jgi:hypothetical protein